MSDQMFNFAKYMILSQAISLILQGGIIYTYPVQYIQPPDIMNQFIFDKDVEIIIIDLPTMLDQYYFYLTNLQNDYVLIDIQEDKYRKVCYIKLKKKQK